MFGENHDRKNFIERIGAEKNKIFGCSNRGRRVVMA